jgi:hypothetical protein
LDQIAPYLRKEHRSLTGTNEFEIVYEGSLDELTNIPLRSVVLMRERQAWLAPSGKWARVYLLADGQQRIIESELLNQMTISSLGKRNTSFRRRTLANDSPKRLAAISRRKCARRDGLSPFPVRFERRRLLDCE